MATTINAQNALQIRQKPMDVFITFQTGSSAKIQTYTPSGSYKSYDSTLGNSDYSMRNLADLADGGFPLDGSCKLYDSTLTPSGNNGKLGLRGTAGQNLTLSISATARLTSITVATRGVGTITVGGTPYTATGLDIIPLNSTSASLVFAPAEANGRAEVDYIVPGISLNITNDNLISCTLALRGNLSVRDHTWEESEIEIQMYYPNEISSAFAYVLDEWPITYRAGYDSDLSETRKFYLSEPVESKDNVITIKGVDASHRLEMKTLQEQWYESYTGNARQTIYNKFVNAITSSGIKLAKKKTWSGSTSGTLQRAIIPEMTARDFVAGVMNLSLSYTYSGTHYGIQFVDAGIPSVEWGDGKTYGRTWTINKSTVGDYSETFERNIAKIQSTNDERKFAETIKVSSSSYSIGGDTNLFNMYGDNEHKPDALYEKDQEIELSYDGYYYDVHNMFNSTSTISVTPSRCVFKSNSNSIWTSFVIPLLHGRITMYRVQNGKCFVGKPVTITGGTNAYTNPNGLPGETLEMEPFVYGIITDANNGSIFSYRSLFTRSARTVSFTWKGDPRMQPLDWVTINNDTGDGRGNVTFRVTSIELTHENGGTIAQITGREWS